METQESALTLALLAVPARAVICRALLEAGEAGLPAVSLAELAGLSLPRATHHFQELVQADVVTLTIRDRRVCYVLKARRAVREALEYVDSSGLG
ncbi:MULTISPECIES: winged helix-turn-helix domain-containing protein [unclassified Cupriavidus]|uniref:winged helix-turn-helix domain-containing protein n=1 Tax=unclassified Cupriavidus TaxID=2640874 RepID=UPI00088B8E6F|nr:winged helix-turn-helix domain-containing protein [Cupriavidus sp. YR651]SDC50235.1 Helix-turn-helix domain-containing protein [Cupriavidus sp. YR651]